MSGLTKVGGCENAARAGDVVFVHGLDGDARTTWQAAGKPENFWPAWLAEEMPEVGVWSLGYEASSMAWKGHTMPLPDRATNILAQLDVHDIGKRPLVFIAHSLGGLLTKQLLRNASDFGNPQWKAIADQTKGVVFLSTPHAGADIATWVGHLATLLRGTVTMDELKAHAPQLRDLNVWYRNNAVALGVATQVYYEKQATRGILIVNATSADPGISGVTPIPLDDDHVSITKPVSRDTLMYLGVKKFVNTIIRQVFEPEPSHPPPELSRLGMYNERSLLSMTEIGDFVLRDADGNQYNLPRRCYELKLVKSRTSVRERIAKYPSAA